MKQALVALATVSSVLACATPAPPASRAGGRVRKKARPVCVSQAIDISSDWPSAADIRWRDSHVGSAGR